MRVHHLNCGCMCPRIPRLFAGHLAPRFSCNCLLLEGANSLILVDTGLGLRDYQDPKRLGLLRHFFGFHMEERYAARHQIQNLGFSPDDVTDIVVTHLDRDHSGGIDDFPRATVHVTRKEFEAATSNRSISSLLRYPKNLELRSRKWNILDLNQDYDWSIFQGIVGHKAF